MSLDEFFEFVEERHAFCTYFERKDHSTDHADIQLRRELDALYIGELPSELTNDGRRPNILDGETIYENERLRNLLLDKGPHCFISHLMDYFELSQIMEMAEHVCRNVYKVVLKTNMKDMKGIFTKLFIRGKGLNDIIRGMILCDDIQTFLDVAKYIDGKTKFHVYIKPTKPGSAWPIPKLLIYNDKTILGRRATVELQFSTPSINNLQEGSNFHKVYESLRNSTQFASARQNDNEFQSFLNILDNEFHCTIGFVPSHGPRDVGGFTIENDDDDDDEDELTSVQMTGEIVKKISCDGILYELYDPSHNNNLRLSSFVVDGNLTVIGSQSFWSVDKFWLKGNDMSVNFSFSFSNRGSVHVGLGTDVCSHGNEIGESVTVHVAADRWWIRKNIFRNQVTFNNNIRGDQKNANISLYLNDNGILEVRYTCDDNEEYAEVQMKGEEYHIFFMSWAGVHDNPIHNVTLETRRH